MRSPRGERGFAAIEDALTDIAQGRMVVVVDDEDRQNEGDLIMAAQFVTAADVNFMTRQAGGWICLALTPERCDELGLDLMAPVDESPHGTPFTVTIEAREGVTTGVSAADQATTIRTAVDPTKRARDLVKPGHVRPLKARKGGVLTRAGHTEASIDLARLAGCEPAAIVCEVQNDDGSMARVPELRRYAARHGLRLITIADLIAYRRRHDTLIERVGATNVPTAFGDFRAIGYRSLIDDQHHLALVKGQVGGADDVLVRVHRQSLLCDVFHAVHDHRSEHVDRALETIGSEQRGVLLYLSQPDQGLGWLLDRAHHAARDAHSPIDECSHGVGAQILADLGLGTIRLLTDDPKNAIPGLDGYGLRVTANIPITSKRRIA